MDSELTNLEFEADIQKMSLFHLANSVVRWVRNRLDLPSVSFGSPAAIVTSMALIIGLDAATVTKAAMIGSLLSLGVGDNLIYVSIVWGFSLLSGLSYLLARARHVSAFPEIYQHVGVAIVVIVISKAIGVLIGGTTGSP
jgi:hypothetical protein